MIKKIILILFLLLSFNPSLSEADNWIDLDWTSWWLWSCGFDWDVWASIDACVSTTSVLTVEWELDITENWGIDFKDIINGVIWKIAGALLLIAIGAIVYSGLVMVISAWEEEKIKKAKEILKWAILGSLAIVIASWLIALVVNFVYSVAG